MRAEAVWMPNDTMSNAHSHYWNPSVHYELDQAHWSLTDINHKIDISAWKPFLSNLPRDPYVNTRWKRMSWLNVLDDGRVEVMGDCPMAQGGMFNDADSMADKLRYYSGLEAEFVARDDVQDFVRAWAELWGIGAREPILFQITGVRGKDEIDPLQGQGIHADGCKYLSILVINRENVSGATSRIYSDKSGHKELAELMIEPGQILHIRDDTLFHSADNISQMNDEAPFERFIIIINSCFVDGFQNRMLRRHFPEAVLNDVF
ncbi:hypothetical protein SAMN05661010_02625 [Modicisalibacter muralis]|uniref:2OG-Fe dioxygenase n=1 Tax=Modicisalibacter muralis TaxID=119000 RepID=A0A1G9N352_9GAMM|nr:2OG-Fe dioxygenase family protein [Halomonas muralis]SDL80930.1 hypothetical protein SAMN05661010_02625 [Halomonas muralis]